MRKSIRKLISAALALGMTMGLLTGSVTTVSADSTKVVSLGANLDDSQRNAVLKYFGVKASEVQIVEVTNQDERNHLSSYIPLEQIGNRTISCAYVQPTSKGGIQVKTANLTYVTSNMIAAALSTSGVKNCNVIAAAPFAVSGTGALTGCIMAYEAATGQSLSESKKDTAVKEMVTTGNVAQNIGQTQATEIVNQIKVNVIQEGVRYDDRERIDEIVKDAVDKAMAEYLAHPQYYEDEVEYYGVSDADLQELQELAETFAAEEYDYEDVEETLNRVEQNVAYSEDGDDLGYLDENPAKELEELGEDNILLETDDHALGEDVVIDATNEAALTDIPEVTPAEPEEDSPFAITTTDEGGFATEEGGTEEYNPFAEGETEEFDPYAEGETEEFDPFAEGETEEFDPYAEVETEEFDPFAEDENYGDTFDEGDFDDLEGGTDEFAGEAEIVEADAPAETAQESLNVRFGSLNAYALRVYVSASVSPEYGTVTITDAAGTAVESIDLASCGTIPMNSSELGNFGWSEGTVICAPVNAGRFNEGTYTASVSASVSTVSGSSCEISGQEQVSYQASLIVPEYTGRCYATDGMATMIVYFPEGAFYAMISSSNESAAAVVNTEVYAEEGVGYASITLGNAGTTDITAEYYDENGEWMNASSVNIGVCYAGGSARAE